MTGLDEAVHRLDAILREAAAREVMPRFRALDRAAVRCKSGPLDLVTEADEAAERMIASRLADAFPDAVVIGEEAAAADPDLIGRLAGAARAIVVDPVDGTANYAAGLPLFGTMAALIEDGQTVAAVIHDPVCGDSAVATRGGGAFIVTTGGTREPLRVAAPASVADMAGKAGPRHFGADAPRLATALLGTLASWDYRCAAHEYRMAASGHCHFLLYSTTMPWDHAPGTLLFTEAGGHVARLDGTPYRAADLSGGLLAAPDATSWHALRDALFG